MVLTCLCGCRPPAENVREHAVAADRASSRPVTLSEIPGAHVGVSERTGLVMNQGYMCFRFSFFFFVGIVLVGGVCSVCVSYSVFFC